MHNLSDLLPAYDAPPQRLVFDVPLIVVSTRENTTKSQFATLKELPDRIAGFSYNEVDSRRTDKRGNPKFILRMDGRPVAIVVCPAIDLAEETLKIINGGMA